VNFRPPCLHGADSYVPANVLQTPDENISSVDQSCCAQDTCDDFHVSHFAPVQTRVASCCHAFEAWMCYGIVELSD
jgi:hypothetical protein